MIPAQWLQWVPGADSEATIAGLAGGTAHRLWRIATDRGHFVLRAPDPAQPRMAGPQFTRELALQRAAAEAGLAPRIFHVDLAQQLLVMEFIDGDPWTAADFGRSEHVSALLDGLSQLHRLPVPALPPLDPVALARGYAQQLLAHDKANSEQLRRRLDAAANAWWQCCVARRRPAIIHCDLHAGNIVRRAPPEAGPAIALLDWEYAHCGDPLLDFAALCAQHPPLQQPVTAYLQAGGAALAQTPLSGDLPAAVAVFRLLSWLWWQQRRLLQDLTAEEARQADVFEYRLDEDLETYAC